MNKIVLGKKIVLGNKIFLRNKNSSNKTNTNSVKDIDPNVIFEEIQAFWEKPVRTKDDVDLSKMILDEFLRIKIKTRKDYENLNKKSATDTNIQLSERIEIMYPVIKNVLCSKRNLL